MRTQTLDWIAAARLERRTGFGATGPSIDAALKMAPAARIAAILAADPLMDPGAKATPPPRFPPIVRPGKGASVEQRGKYRDQLREHLAALTAWWIMRMIAVDQPFGEKLTFGWHNHFATSGAKVRFAPLMLAQNDTLRRLGRGDFPSLAQTMLTDAAMLLWLDGQKNTAKAPNENLSREFMELFALGHGDGYTEADVREGARALTGWRIDVDGTTELVRDCMTQAARPCSALPAIWIKRRSAMPCSSNRTPPVISPNAGGANSSPTARQAPAPSNGWFRRTARGTT
jgi:uncharacterized protein (DUF1800 family)